MKTRIGLIAALMVLTILALGFAAPAHAAVAGDRNHDLIPDWWEIRWHLSLRVNQARLDADRDGLNNLYEYRSRTSPRLRDTDRDGVRDGAENPDHDRLSNWSESKVWTNPRLADTDRDGVPDWREDPDRDLLGSYFEFVDRTSPMRADTDRDGVKDGFEDADCDKLNNVQETIVRTHGLRWDTDGDDVRDGDEDYDNDGLNNSDEFDCGTDPTDPDSDNDGCLDGDELGGTVVSFDRATGILVIQPFEEWDPPGDESSTYNIGTRCVPDAVPPTVSVTVNATTTFAWEDAEEAEEDGDAPGEPALVRCDTPEPAPTDPPTADNLVPGVVLTRVDTEAPGDGSLLARHIVFAWCEDWGPDDPVLDPPENP